MDITKEQLLKQMCNHAQKENCLNDLLEFMLESMMVAERGEFLAKSQGNKGNGYRPGHTYGHGRRLEFRIPTRPLRQLSPADSGHSQESGGGLRTPSG